MANPALPILGSTLLKLANEKSNHRRRERVGESFDPIDAALKGGLDYGRISCISGDKSQGKSTIAMHFLITHLLSSPISQAAVIDTTGTFDLLRFHEVIVARVKSKILAERARQIGDLQPEMSPPPPPTENADTMAERALERLKILRVFDFVGVVEAVGELSEELRCDDPTESDVNKETQPNFKSSPHKPRTEIADSDEEDDSEEDMLFTTPLPTTKTKTTSTSHPPSIPLEKIGMIIIDNVTQPLAPILKTNYTRAQSLLTTFLTSLRHLTTTYDIATLLLNMASVPKSSFPYNHGNPSTKAPPQSTYLPDPLSATPTFSDQVSIFASTSVRPALGKTFAYQLDLHLLVSSLPKRRRDAEVVVGGKSGRAEVVGVIEVLGDRVDDRVGMWTAYRIEKDGSLKAAF